jgi:hypothetical protein
MKTSTKLFLGAVLLLGICLGFYDWKLGAEYRKGDYADPYYGYVPLNYRDFDEIELRSSSAVNLVLVQGDFKVLEHPHAPRFVVVRQEGKRLIIEAKFLDHFETVNAAQTLFISCPKLSVFNADAKYTIGPVAVTDYENADPKWLATVIRGFIQDSLTIREEHASNVWLEGDRIGRLTAVAGAARGDTGEEGAHGVQVKMLEGVVVRLAPARVRLSSADNGPMLVIGEGNHFDSSNLNILNKGQLWIKGMDIRQLTYHLADSATLTVNGLAARYLNLH